MMAANPCPTTNDRQKRYCALSTPATNPPVHEIDKAKKKKRIIISYQYYRCTLESCKFELLSNDLSWHTGAAMRIRWIEVLGSLYASEKWKYCSGSVYGPVRESSKGPEKQGMSDMFMFLPKFLAQY